MFYHFSQNNSGGRFVVDHRRGITAHVIVEGPSLKDITRRAEDIGLYWDGCDDGHDCPCCGDRWSEPYGNGDTVPSIYGQDVSNGVYYSDYPVWIKDGPEGYIHYLDGRIVPVVVECRRFSPNT